MQVHVPRRMGGMLAQTPPLGFGGDPEADTRISIRQSFADAVFQIFYGPGIGVRDREEEHEQDSWRPGRYVRNDFGGSQVLHGLRDAPDDLFDP